MITEEVPLERVEEISHFFGISRNRVLQCDLSLSVDDRDRRRQRPVLPEIGSGSGHIVRKNVWK
jgi:hypothetical protein